ncbi:MAG: VWA domain-containing protein [Gemmataceae bacterium]|nr:VWA domain-containing protein [Gemmataceae bacterium]
MNPLTKLLGVEVPPGTALSTAELHFRGLLPWWLALVVLVGLGAVVGYMYRQERGEFGPVRRSVMIGLRIVLLAMVLFFLARPLLLAEFTGQRRSGVVVLLDNSQSMSQRDRRVREVDQLRVALAKDLLPPTTKITGDDPAALPPVPAETPKDPSRAELVRWVLANPKLKLAEGLANHGPLRPYLVGQRLRGTLDEAGPGAPLERLLASFRADEAKTALADAIYEVLQRKDGDTPAAIVVISDGQDNASKYTLAEAGAEAARLGVPLHLWGVGSSDAASLAIKEVAAPDTLFVDDTITVPIRWRALGFQQGTIEVVVTLGGKEVARKERAVQLGADVRDVISFVVPKGKDKEELRDLVVRVQLKGSNQFRDDMRREVRVVDRKIRVLVIEHSPRFEYKFLQAALLRDRRVEADFLLVQADPKVAKSGPPFLPEFPPSRAKFFDARYNVILLGDVAATYLGREHLDWIKEFVEKRGGLIVLAGRQHMPATYLGTPLAEMLPVEFTAQKFKLDPEARTQEYPPTLTEAGQRTDWLALADGPEDNLKTWSELPGFFWHYPVTKLRPAAVSLVVNARAKMGDQPMPIVAAHWYGQGQVIFLGTDETWRWRYNVQDKLFVRFWGQLIYQAGLPSLLGESAKRVHVALERSQAVLGQPGSIYVRLLDKLFNPRLDPQVEAQLEYLDAQPGQPRLRKLTLQAVPGRPGDYRALLPHDHPGRFVFKVANPDTATFSYRVEPPPLHELDEIGMAEKELRELAELSGGRFYREEDLAGLAEAITTRHTPFTRRQEILLWNPLAFLVFLALITAEWLVRKFSNLI